MFKRKYTKLILFCSWIFNNDKSISYKTYKQK